MKISLARALKEKARLGRKISDITGKMRYCNSKMAENEDYEYDINKLGNDFDLYTERLIELKVKISNANVEINNKIFELGESKNKLTVIQSISVKIGVTDKYENTVEIWDSQWNREDIDKRVDELQKKIDNLQDEIDDFNGTTKIEIDWL